MSGPASQAGTPAVQRYLQGLVDRGLAPGLQYVAVDAHGVTATGAAGWADIGRRIPLTAGTTLMAYSMTKTVTAIAVLQLAERGQISLDATAASYLPTWAYAPDTTVRQLLSHTGGLPNPLPLRWVHHADAHDRFDEAGALAAVMRQHARPANRPGTRFRYSNLGYWLLGTIVEQVTRRTFAEFVTERIFQPLGLSPRDIGFRVSDRTSHATGYLERVSLANLLGGWLMDRTLLGPYEGRWRRVGAHYPNGPAFGGIVGTAHAFARLLQDQLQPQPVLLGADARRWLFEEQSTRGGVRVPMTLGWHVASRGGDTVFFKEGGGGGYHCLMWLSPQRRRGSVLMSNATSLDVRSCLEGADRA